MSDSSAFSVSSEPSDHTIWRRLLHRLRPYVAAIILASVLNLGVAATHLLASDLVKHLFDHGFGPTRDPNYVWLVPVVVIGLFLLRGACIFFSSYIMAWLANGMLYTLRSDMYQKILRLPDLHFKKNDSSALMNKFTVDAGNVSLVVVEVLTTVIRESLVVIGLIGYLLYLAPSLTGIMLILIPLAAVVTRFFAKRLRRINIENIAINAQLHQSVKESIQGQRVIKVFNAYDFLLQRFSSINQRLRRIGIRNAVSSAAVSPITQLIAAIVISFVISIAIALPESSGMTVGTFTAFIIAIVQILDPLKRLSNTTGTIQRMLASAQSVFDLLDMEEEKSAQATASRQSAVVKGSLTMKSVSYQYPNTEQPVLQDIDISVQAGETIALVGRSGSGKSTLLSLIPRFMSPDTGSITLDESDIQHMGLAELRQHIAVVNQDTVLFDDTIAANVAFGSMMLPSSDGKLSQQTEAEVTEALRLAYLEDLILQHPKGIYAPIGDNGNLLSGGQRQRLAIARAIMKNAPILILDEATSALDNESERLVQASLEKLMVGKTTFIIAHRLSTVLHADTILVMDQGRIVERGDHASLMAESGLYAKLYALQFANAV